LVERFVYTEKVSGSNPLLSNSNHFFNVNKNEEMAEWLKAVDCKSIKFNFT